MPWLQKQNSFPNRRFREADNLKQHILINLKSKTSRSLKVYRMKVHVYKERYRSFGTNFPQNSYVRGNEFRNVAARRERRVLHAVRLELQRS